MKQLKDLKEEILNNKFNNFYIFYGEDYGLRKHYIDAIAKHYDGLVVLDDYVELSNSKGSALIITKTLYLIYDCSEICNLTVEQIEGFIKKLKYDCVILDFETLSDKTNLFRNFGDYITYFPLVEDKIGFEFVQSEVSLIRKSSENLALNCSNNYNSILLETDKIKQYSNAKEINQQQAYDVLNMNKQLIIKPENYDNDLIINDLLLYNSSKFAYWEQLITCNYVDEFWYNLGRTTNDFLIAYFIAKLGKWDGGKAAYTICIMLMN